MDIKNLFGGVSLSSTKNNATDKANAKLAAENNDTPNEKSKSANQEKVTLTATAARFQQAQITLGTQPEVNRERVSELRKAIAEGTYKVDAGRLASRMLQFESELSAR